MTKELATSVIQPNILKVLEIKIIHSNIQVMCLKKRSIIVRLNMPIPVRSALEIMHASKALI